MTLTLQAHGSTILDILDFLAKLSAWPGNPALSFQAPFTTSWLAKIAVNLT